MSGIGAFRNYRLKIGTLAYDGLASALSFFLALNFAFGRGARLVDLHDPISAAAYTAGFGAVGLIMAYTHGLHRGIWRYTSFSDCLNVLRVVTLTLLVFVPIAFVFTRADQLPRSAPILAWFLMVAFLLGPRMIVRAWSDQTIPRPFAARGMRTNEVAIPILLAGSAARVEPFLRELRQHPSPPYLVAGVLTIDTGWHGRTMHGIGVLGRPSDVANALAYLHQRNVRPHRLVIADDEASQDTISSYLEAATLHGLTLGRLPRLMDFDGSSIGAATVQTIALGDLLGRPQVVIDRQTVATLIVGKRVLITGAGGSIGSELARQVSDLSPSELVLVESSEFNLYSIDKELEERHPDLARVSALCDVRDRIGLQKWFASHRPEIVFHAAALKHVPIVEAHPIEGAKTNILGTQNVADLCAQFGAVAMVLISTDKAVNPHNVMGASKRCAEAYCQALDAQGGPTRFVAVRFGNVLGSAGSVVPLFQRQIAAGGPVTVTHPEISRFFMTIPEAVSLVLQASALGVRQDASRGGVYVLDMGKAVKIADLARQMIRLAGKKADVDIMVEFIGLRPGEKLYEEVVHAAEELSDTSVNGVMIVSPRTSELAILKTQFTEFLRATQAMDVERVLRLLHVIVPEFRRQGEYEITLKAIPEGLAHAKATSLTSTQ